MLIDAWESYGLLTISGILHVFLLGHNAIVSARSFDFYPVCSGQLFKLLLAENCLRAAGWVMTFNVHVGTGMIGV
jgi:hypothetical protein